MSCLGILLPLLGLVAYANHIWWLFYLAGGIAAVLDIIAIINGDLGCFGAIITIVFWVLGYQLN